MMNAQKAQQDNNSTGRKILFWFYTALLVCGILLYWYWGFMYNTWTDPGIYAVCAVLIAFGILGILLHLKP
jgi:glycopeptide antibiotics resistance protein